MEIKKIELLSYNLSETETFYTEVLGFEINSKTYDSISFVVGNSTLLFRKTENIKPVYHFAFTIPNNQLQEAKQWLSSKISLIEFDNNPITDFPNWNAQSVYFLDDNGNILECIARFDLDNASDEAFSGSSTVSISEIAFVTNNVDALAHRLISENDFRFFEKQEQRSDFSVIGDESGLLIMVDSKRNWFPTSIKAENFWMKITIVNDGKTIELENA